MCDLFYFLEGVAVVKQADDTTPYCANRTNDLVIKEIRALFGDIDDHTIISENKNELLGIILDSKLSFEDHINNLCKQIKNSKH